MLKLEKKLYHSSLNWEWNDLWWIISSKVKDSSSKIIENINYKEMIWAIKDYSSLIDFIHVFKGKPNEEKLDFIYFKEFTEQLVKHIDSGNLENIDFNDKMSLYKDIFWAGYQSNEYNVDWHILWSFTLNMKDLQNPESKLYLYYWDKLLRTPMTYSEMYDLKYKNINDFLK